MQTLVLHGKGCGNSGSTLHSIISPLWPQNFWVHINRCWKLADPVITVQFVANALCTYVTVWSCCCTRSMNLFWVQILVEWVAMRSLAHRIRGQYSSSLRRVRVNWETHRTPSFYWTALCRMKATCLRSWREFTKQSSSTSTFGDK